MYCSVCYTNKYLLETSCKHVFCYECLSKWFSQKINCPYCRKNLLFNLKFTDLTYNNKRSLRSHLLPKKKQFISAILYKVLELFFDAESYEYRKEVFIYTTKFVYENIYYVSRLNYDKKYQFIFVLINRLKENRPEDKKEQSKFNEFIIKFNDYLLNKTN